MGERPCQVANGITNDRADWTTRSTGDFIKHLLPWYIISANALIKVSPPFLEWEASPPHYLPMFIKCLCHQLTCFNFKLLPNDLVSLAAQTRSLVHRFNTIWQLNTQLSPISPTTPGRCRSKDSIKSTSTVELEVKPVQSRSLAKLPPYSTRTTTLTRPV